MGDTPAGNARRVINALKEFQKFADKDKEHLDKVVSRKEELQNLVRSPDHSYSDQLAACEKEASRLRAQIAVCAACGAFTDSRQLYLLSVHALMLVTRFYPTLICIIRNTVIEYEKRKGSRARETAEKAADYEHFGYPAEVFRRGTSPESEGHRRDSENRIRHDRRPQSHPAEHSEPHGLRLQHRVQRVYPHGAEPQNRQPEESYLWSDFYLEQDFTDGELRLLIDSLLFSKHIPYSQCKELVGKLEGLSNAYFRSRVKHIARLPEDKTDNKQLFLTIELLDEAISRGRTLDLATYMKEHPYMYASDNVQTVFRVAKAMVSDVIDLFGTEVTFSDEDDAGVTVTAFTNEMAMEQFALNFAPDVTVLESQRLREKVKSALEKALEKYN